MYPGAYLATTPNKPAVVMADTGVIVTFAELESRSARIARYFRQIGLRRGDHLALLSDNDHRVFDVYWAAMRSGVYLTAINRHLTTDELAYIVNDCGATALVASAALSDLAEKIVDLTPGVSHRLVFGGDAPGHVSLDEVLRGVSDAPLEDQPRGNDMLYSSGTTGRPKGIKPALPERQIEDPGDPLVELCRTMWRMGPDTVYLSTAPLYHAAPLRTAAGAQALGGTVVVMGRFDPELSLSYIERYRVTHSQWVPTMFVRMLKLADAVRNRYDVSSMRVAIHAAAPCPVEIKRAMIEWWGPVLLEFYSSTEVNGMTFISSEEWLRKPGSVGRSVLGTVHVCAEDGTELPAGEIGIVYFERDVMPFEYHNDPDKTREAQHPAHDNWSTTGDVGYVDPDRYLYLTDRTTFMIISGGVNIYPQEIESALTVHPKVLDVAVIGVPDTEMGESVMAVVQVVPGIEPSDEVAEELLDFLRTRLARYKVPRRVEFTDELPRTPTGKLVKGKLRDRYRATADA